MSPRHNDHTSEGCLAAREVLNRVGDKWSVLIVAMLGDGPKRFTELKRNIEGVSQRMLTLTLRGLERDGLVSRKARRDAARTRPGARRVGERQPPEHPGSANEIRREGSAPRCEERPRGVFARESLGPHPLPMSALWGAFRDGD